MSQQLPWGSSRHQQSTRVTPISTAFSQEQRNTPSPNGTRSAFSPAASNFPSLPSASTRLVGSRKSSAASSTSSPFSPSHSGQQLPVSQLLSSRTRNIAPNPASHLGSSAAALPTALQSGGGASNSGGGAHKLARASPSLSTSSTVGSPKTAGNSSSGLSGQSLSKIVVAQVFLLLGQLREEKDRAKWPTQTEQIRKVSPSHHCYRLNGKTDLRSSWSIPTAWRSLQSLLGACCNKMHSKSSPPGREARNLMEAINTSWTKCRS